MIELRQATEEEAKTKPKISTMTFMATEGGRKCPHCGRYAKFTELGWVGTHFTDPRGLPSVILDSYGHLKGYGCNK
jgi:hypothetical protein